MMRFINIALVVILAILLYKIVYKSENTPNEFTSELITKRSYPVEVHNKVLTEDGYILTLHRIPYGLKSGKDVKNRYPVLLVPGLFGTSSNYVWMDADNALGFLLADLGYDVWLGNIRSASYCQKHVKYDANIDPEFWNYTTNEVSYYDISASIDYVLKTTGFKSLQYIGHSQGTLLLAILLSERPDYNKKLDLFVGLAPGFYLNATKDPALSTFFNYQDTIMKFTDFFGIQFLTYFPSLVTSTLHNLCSIPYLRNRIQSFLISLGGEGDPNFEVIMDVLPTFSEGTGLKQFYHNGQLYKTGTLQKYNYGKDGNLQEYGVENPPSYNIKNVKVPTAIYYSTSDIFIATENIERISKDIPNVVEKHVITEPFSHVDFILGKKAADLVYKRFFKVMEMYKKNK